MLLGSKEREIADRPENFLNIGVPEPEINKVQEKTGSNMDL